MYRPITSLLASLLVFLGAAAPAVHAQDMQIYDEGPSRGWDTLTLKALAWENCCFCLVRQQRTQRESSSLEASRPKRRK
jgi:hypothetical protein